MSKASILIVEDEAIVAADLATKLDQLDYAISATTAYGAEALTLARDRRPDLVLMDIRLKGPLDGVAAAEQIRRECDLPVIYLTAHSDPVTLERAKLTQPFGYILKPFEELELETHIQMALYKHQVERNLRESEERFRAAFEQGAIAMAVIAFDCRLLRVNAAFCQMLGCPEAELLGSTCAQITHPDDFPAYHAGVQRLVRGEQPSFRMEKRYLRRDGNVVWGDLSAVAVRDAGGRPLYLLTQMQDITERKRAEEALATANEELQATNEELRTTEEELRVLSESLSIANLELEQRVLDRTAQLRALAGELTQSEERERRRIAKILHDHLQQLMVGARLRVEVLRARKDSKPLHKALGHIEKLIDESVEVSRGLSHELGSPVLHEGGLAAALKWLARWMHKNHGLTVRVQADVAAEPLEENVKVLLFQSVRELLFNVVKHARVKRARVKMELGRDDELEIVVSDHGRGFDPQPLNEGRETSAGFGLFSIRERLAWLGGRLEVRSQPGRGSRFRLCAPLHEPPKAKSPPETPSAPPPAQRRKPSKVRAAGPPATRKSQARIRVLLADDHEIVRRGLARLLRDQRGLEVVGVASDGQEALEQTADLQPDLVIMDVSMPRMDGVEATRQITAAWPHIKVIGLTMHSDDSRHEAMRAAGAVDCHVKSSSSQDLIRAIRAAFA